MTELLKRTVRRIENVFEVSFTRVGKSLSLHYAPLTHSSRHVR